MNAEIKSGNQIPVSSLKRQRGGMVTISKNRGQSKGLIRAGMKSNYRQILKRQRGGISGQTRTGQSNREGHPARPIKTPKRFLTTSSSDKENVSRKYRKGTGDIEEDFTTIRNAVKETNLIGNEKESHQMCLETNDGLVRSLNPAASLEHSTNLKHQTAENTSLQFNNGLSYTQLLNAPCVDPVNATYEDFSRSASSYTYNPQYTRSSYENVKNSASIYELQASQRQDYNQYNAPATITSGEHAIYPSTYNFNEQEGTPHSAINKKQIQCMPRDSDTTDTATAIRNSTNVGSRDSDMERLRKTVEEVKTGFVCLCEKVALLATKGDYTILNDKLDKLLRKQRNIMPIKPRAFPLQSIEQVAEFNNVTEDEYDAAVEYLRFLGGYNVHDAVKHCMKEAMSDATIRHYSAWGERGNLPLFDTRIIKAIYDAVALNTHFTAPTQDVFFREVGEAVRFGKQRNRVAAKRGENDVNKGRRQRQRIQAGNLLAQSQQFEREEEEEEEVNLENGGEDDLFDEVDQRNVD